MRNALTWFIKRRFVINVVYVSFLNFTPLICVVSALYILYYHRTKTIIKKQHLPLTQFRAFTSCTNLAINSISLTLIYNIFLLNLWDNASMSPLTRLVHPLLTVWCAAHTRYLVIIVLNIEFIIVWQLQREEKSISVTFDSAKTDKLQTHLFSPIYPPFRKDYDSKLAVHFYNFRHAVWIAGVVDITS